VHAYEAMKIRILNAGHQVLANAGELLSVPTIADCMAHPAIGAMFHAKVQTDEILPYVAAVPGTSPAAYLDLIAHRFANPAIHDTPRRVAFDGGSRHPGFVLPILRDALAAGGSVRGLALVEALWARMCAGSREDGTAIEPNDPQWERLTAAAAAARERPRAWLEQPSIYGDLYGNAVFGDAFDRWLAMIWQEGTAAALAAYARRALPYARSPGRPCRGARRIALCIPGAPLRRGVATDRRRQNFPARLRSPGRSRARAREGARRAAGAAPCRQPQPWPRMPWCPANRALHPWRAVAPLRRNRPAPPEFPRAASPARTLPGARPGGRPPRGGRCPMLSATAPGQSASPGAASRSRRGRGGGAGGGPAAMSHAHCSLV
jgi:hypothetical protein